MWENHYKGISDANIAMDQILQSDMSESKKLTSLGEMLFIRSFLYFELVQQFGKVPLVTEGSFEIRTDFKRAAIADIYKQIITDLVRLSNTYRKRSMILKKKSNLLCRFTFTG